MDEVSDKKYAMDSFAEKLLSSLICTSEIDNAVEFVLFTCHAPDIE